VGGNKGATLGNLDLVQQNHQNAFTSLACLEPLTIFAADCRTQFTHYRRCERVIFARIYQRGMNEAASRARFNIRLSPSFRHRTESATWFASSQ
jgi:hypothetical protein